MKFRLRSAASPARLRPLHPAALPWLIAALMLAALPHFAYLPAWLIVLVTGIVLGKLAASQYPRLKPGRLVIFLLTLGALAGIQLQYTTIFGPTAGTSLLIVMLFLKLLETGTHRDGMIAVIMTYFLVITHFLNHQSIPTALYMLLVIAFITLALISLNQGPGGIPWRDKLRLAGPLMAYSLPLMILLFVLFPRIPGPLWGLPADTQGGKTGLSEEMTPGQISQLARSDEVAFRVKFHGKLPPPHQLYWRALVLWEYDGRTWRPGRQYYAGSHANNPVEYAVTGKPFEYTVTLEPHQQRWLFALDIPVLDDYASMSGSYRLFLDGNLDLLASRPVISLARYRLRSYADYRLGRSLDPATRARALQLPATGNPRSRALAQHWQNQANGRPEEIVASALQLFGREFTYTMRAPALGSQAVDEFIFDSKRGYCEHFAGSFTFLMRAAGVPARVVTGYLGGEINPLGDYMLVRQADAHAWAEVWLRDRGWVRVDPTSAVSPLRIEGGLDEILSERENPRFVLHRGAAAIAKLRLVWDSVNNGWNQWVLGYNQDTQKRVMWHLGFKDAGAASLVTLLTVSLSIALIIISIGSLKNRRYRKDKIQRLYLKLGKRLAKAGYPRRPHEGPVDYLQRIGKQNPALGRKLRPVLQTYALLRYGSQASPAGIQHFRKMIRRFTRGGQRTGAV
jgi:transglutaminase-like putative cysteine protease